MLDFLKDTWNGLPTWGKAGIGLGGATLGYFLKRKYQNEDRAYRQQLQNYYDNINSANNYNPYGDYYNPVIAQQEARQENIESAFNTLGDMFSGREGLYDQVADDTYALGKEYLDEEKGEAARQLKFSLARSGLSGGSVDIDKRSELNTRYLDGLSMARAEADSAASAFRNQDMALRNNLMGLAAGGNISGEQLASFGAPVGTAPVSAPSNLGQTFVGLTDFIGASRNPFAAGLGGGGSAGTGRPSNVNSRYTGSVVT